MDAVLPSGGGTSGRFRRQLAPAYLHYFRGAEAGKGLAVPESHFFGFLGIFGLDWFSKIKWGATWAVDLCGPPLAVV
jgi:hypothetical protein